jgi:hypothetical protein
MRASLFGLPGRGFPLRQVVRPARPAVLFMDQVGYEQFDQMACCLRRRGIGAVKIFPRRTGRGGRSAPTLARLLRDRLYFDRCVRLDAPGQIESIEDGVLGGFRIIDVLMSEFTVASMGLGHPMLQALGRRSLAFAAHPVRQLLDKFEVNVLLQAGGVRTPPQRAANACTAQEAIQAFGLPIVVKSRIGLGGDGVRIADSLDEAESAVQELCQGDLSRGFFQSHVEGKQVGYICVRGADGPLLEFGYQVNATQWPLGPSAKVAVDKDPLIAQAGRNVVDALGSRGLAQIDMIRDSAGQVWPIDANLRSSGNILSFLCLNLDFPDAYARLLTGRPQRPARPQASIGHGAADVFPLALYEWARGRSPARLADLLRHFQLICRRGPGWRYRLVVMAKWLSLLPVRRAVGREPSPERSETSTHPAPPLAHRHLAAVGRVLHREAQGGRQPRAD